MRTLIVATCGLSLSLSGCYVVPLDHHGRPSNVAYAPVPTPVPAPPSNINLIARLYPANELATRTGLLSGQVQNFLNGRGTFFIVAFAEQYTGEATRVVGESARAHEGVANATGNRGGYLRCRYTLNSSEQGSGECEFANGARYTLHLGN